MNGEAAPCNTEVEQSEEIYKIKNTLASIVSLDRERKAAKQVLDDINERFAIAKERAKDLPKGKGI